MVTKLIPLSFFLLFLLCFSRLVLSRFINEIADKVGGWVVLKKEELRKLLKRYPNDINLSEMLDELRVLCANEKSNDVLKILDDVLEISKSSSNLKFKVNLYELRIKQLCRFKENLQSVEEFLEEMTQTARSINYVEGLALSFQIREFGSFPGVQCLCAVGLEFYSICRRICRNIDQLRCYVEVLVVV